MLTPTLRSASVPQISHNRAKKESSGQDGEWSHVVRRFYLGAGILFWGPANPKTAFLALVQGRWLRGASLTPQTSNKKQAM